MDRNRSDENDDETIPWTAWSSLVSIDAVLVAVVWQTLFTRTFLDRSPAIAEVWSLGSAVWLIYVADRLLDASRLDLTRPHTLRHRFHHRHARTFCVIWVLVLIVTVAVVVSQLSFALIQAGLMLAAAVLVYGAGVHFLPRTDDRDPDQCRFIPNALFTLKEIQVGVLFAAGVSLVSWTHVLVNDSSARGALFLATVIAAVLFSVNCLLVAHWEAVIDRAQSFSPAETWDRLLALRWLCTWGLVTVPVLGYVRPGSSTFWLSGLAGLVGMIAIRRYVADEPTEQASLTRWERRGLYADWMLWIPPTLITIL